jgi:hypothetical protein
VGQHRAASFYRCSVLLRAARRPGGRAVMGSGGVRAATGTVGNSSVRAQVRRVGGGGRGGQQRREGAVGT